MLLHTLQRFVRFHNDILALGGRVAATAAFADFDTNRRLQPCTHDGEAQESEAHEETPDSPGRSSGTRQLLVTGLVSRVAGLRAGAEPEAETQQASVANQDGSTPLGFLDVWVLADAEFVSEKLVTLLGASEAAWRPRPLSVGAAPVEAAEQPEAAELATLVADLFEKARERAECLVTSQASYTRRVLGPGLEQAISAVKSRWNSMSDVIVEIRCASLLLETLEEISRFCDGFPLGVHLVREIDEGNALRVGMRDKLVTALIDQVRGSLRLLREEPGATSAAVAVPLGLLAKRLRPSSFQSVVRPFVTKAAELLYGHLLRQPPFSSQSQAELFAANCREDLSSLLALFLAPGELEEFQPLWEGCCLLALPEAEGARTLAELRRIRRCRLSSEATAEATSEDTPAALVQRRQQELLAAAGAPSLPVADAITVLGRRPGLLAEAEELQDASEVALLLGQPVHHIAVAAMAAQAALPAAAQEKLQAGVTELRAGVGGLSGRAELLARAAQGRAVSGAAALASRLYSASGAVATT